MSEEYINQAEYDAWLAAESPFDPIGIRNCGCVDDPVLIHNGQLLIWVNEWDCIWWQLPADWRGRLILDGLPA